MITKQEIREHQPSKMVSQSVYKLFNQIDENDAKKILNEPMILGHCNHTMWQPDVILTLAYYYTTHDQPVHTQTITALKEYLTEHPDQNYKEYGIWFEKDVEVYV